MSASFLTLIQSRRQAKYKEQKNKEKNNPYDKQLVNFDIANFLKKY